MFNISPSYLSHPPNPQRCTEFRLRKNRVSATLNSRQVEIQLPQSRDSTTACRTPLGKQATQSVSLAQPLLEKRSVPNPQPPTY
ncbi:MAG: hypothetical protein V7L20_32510 [Nostoc sp.]